MSATIIPFNAPMPTVDAYRPEPAIVLILPVVRVEGLEHRQPRARHHPPYNCRCTLGPIDEEALKEP